MSETVYIPESTYPRIVIVGVGFAGLEFAKRLRNKPFQVILVDENNFHQFPPLFYQVATSGLEPDSIAFSVRKLFRNANNVFFRMAKVQSIDAVDKAIETSIGVISYDYLVIATGTTNNFYGMDEVEEHSLGLKTIQESLDVRSFVLENLERATDDANHEVQDFYTNIVICGGGPAGVELAGAFAEFKKYVFQKDYKELDIDLFQIYLVEGTGELLGTMSDRSSKNALKVLEKIGVNVLLNTLVQSYNGKTVQLNSGESIESATLIWTAGVSGQVIDGLQNLEIKKGNRMAVGSQFQVLGYEDIFAIGDVACLVEEKWPNGHPQIAPAAIQHGKYLANYFLNGFKSTKSFRFFDKGQLATIGKKNAVLDQGKFHLQGYLAWFVWATVHLFSISGFQNKLRVGLNWIGSYFRYDKRNRIIIRKYRKREEG